MHKHRSAKLIAALTAALLALVAIPILAEVASPNSLRRAIDVRYPGVDWVTTVTLADWMSGDNGRSLVVLDAREEREFAVSHLRGARRVAPERRDFTALDIPRDATIVVYCSVGYRSAEIAQRLKAGGHQRVFNLQGGLFQWANEGRTLFSGTERAERVHPYDNDWGRMLLERYRAPL